MGLSLGHATLAVMNPLRTVEVKKASPGEPADYRLRFYGGIIDVGVDNGRRFVGCKVQGDLEADEPLFVPGEGVPVSFLGLTGLPIKLLTDARERVIGVHVTGKTRCATALAREERPGGRRVWCELTAPMGFNPAPDAPNEGLYRMSAAHPPSGLRGEPPDRLDRPLPLVPRPPPFPDQGPSDLP